MATYRGSVHAWCGQDGFFGDVAFEWRPECQYSVISRKSRTDLLPGRKSPRQSGGGQDWAGHCKDQRESPGAETQRSVADGAAGGARSLWATGRNLDLTPSAWEAIEEF